MCEQIFDNLQLKALNILPVVILSFYRITTGAHLGTHTHHRPGTHVPGGEVFLSMTMTQVTRKCAAAKQEN